MPRPKKKNLGERIRELRDKKGLSQDQLGRIAEIPTVSVSKIEVNAVKNPTIRTIARIADALEVSLDELIKDLFIDKK